MSGAHPLDRPVWNAFSGRQAALAVRDGPAVRVRRDIGIFAATADDSPQSLAALARLAAGDDFATVEAHTPPAPPGYRLIRSAPCLQMVMIEPAAAPPIAFEDLDAADSAAMLALATLTEPGPFKTHTHEFGGFIGVRHEGALIAMAGQRLQPEGHVEVSGVCTHPDHRGKGHAAALMAVVAQRILARGETPILHTYASNTAANALYERLGYRTRRTLTLSFYAPG